jgi:RIO kinase 1
MLTLSLLPPGERSRASRAHLPKLTQDYRVSFAFPGGSRSGIGFRLSRNAREEAITHQDREEVRSSRFTTEHGSASENGVASDCRSRGHGWAAAQLGKTDRADDPVFQAGNLGQRRAEGEAGNVVDDWDEPVLLSDKGHMVSGARAWTREGKLDRDHAPTADGRQRPTARRMRPDDVGLLTSIEVAALGDGPKDPLELFADGGYITDVVNRVKSGKEATVYCCRAHPSTGRELVAAKVYEIDIAAHYRMSKLYAVYKPDSRQERAIKSGKHRGKEMVFADWVGQEYANLCAFHAAGADVPAPIAQCGPGILMDYIGDAVRPAPTLVGAELSTAEAQRLFDQAMRNIRIFLAKDRVHGDLSPYNMLLWKDRLVIIDLPQVVHARWNDEAFKVLQRDIENILQFFSRRGVKASATELAIDLWTRYRRGELDREVGL